MSFTNGTIVAATTVQEDILRQITGLTPTYHAARVLGPTKVPIEFAVQSPNFEAYVAEPLNADGSPISESDWKDAAVIIVWHPDMPIATEATMGQIHTVVHTKKVSKSDFLASMSARIESETEQAYAELQRELFEVTAQLDDEADPDFLD